MDLGCSVPNKQVPATNSAESPKEIVSYEIDVPASALMESKSTGQLITGEFNGEIKSMRFEIEQADGRLTLVGITHIGIPLFSIVYEEGNATVKKYVGEFKQLDPHWILNDFFLSYFSHEELRESLTRLSLTLVEYENERRLLNKEKHVLVRIIYDRHNHKELDYPSVQVENYNFGYSLDVQTLTEYREN